MSDEPKHLGLTSAQWRQLYEDGNWKEAFAQAAFEVSTCIHASPADRESATGIFSAMVRQGLLKDTDFPGDRGLPQVIRDNQIAMVRGGSLVRDDAKRAWCADRVLAMRIMGEMLLSIQEQPGANAAIGAALQAILGSPPKTTADN